MDGPNTWNTTAAPQVRLHAYDERLQALDRTGCLYIGGERGLRQAGLPPPRVRDLRYAHASIMLSEDVHPRVVQEQLGHASVTITLDTYSHVTPGIQLEAVQRVGKVLDARGHPGNVV